jgi:hypothetical protein
MLISPGLSLVDLAPVPDLENFNDPHGIVDRIDNPVVSLPDPITLQRRQFLAAARPRLAPERSDPLDNPPQVLFRNPAQFICG